MKPPLSYRREIPFFYNKNENEFRKDVYERYEEMVVRQSAIHLADYLWGKYPMQEVLSFAEQYYPKNKPENILEIGCGVGRWIATLAQKFPFANCWGIDFSYQMLKQANSHWVQGKEIHLDLSNKGFKNSILLKGQHFKNLSFGLAKAYALPFFSDSQDLIINSFLLDRLEFPIKGLQEMYRILKPGGTMILLSPLNFQYSNHWELFYPKDKIEKELTEIGFNNLKIKDNILIREPLDFHGNFIQWNCLGVAGIK